MNHEEKTVFIICCLFGIISVKNVYDALMTKTLRTTCAGTSASITAIYYTHETTKWKINKRKTDKWGSCYTK